MSKWLSQKVVIFVFLFCKSHSPCRKMIFQRQKRKIRKLGTMLDPTKANIGKTKEALATLDHHQVNAVMLCWIELSLCVVKAPLQADVLLFCQMIALCPCQLVPLIWSLDLSIIQGPNFWHSCPSSPTPSYLPSFFSSLFPSFQCELPSSLSQGRSNCSIAVVERLHRWTLATHLQSSGARRSGAIDAHVGSAIAFPCICRQSI